MHTAELNVHVVVCACVGVTHFVWVCCYKNESYIHENRLKMASSQLNLNFILILKDALECITLHIGYKQIQGNPASRLPPLTPLLLIQA